jgi:hypothetical protein
MVSEEKQRRWERNDSKKKWKAEKMSWCWERPPPVEKKSKFDVNELQLPVRLD